MSHSRLDRKYQAKESPLYETDVWECSDIKCGCWMRKSMAFVTEPRCPLCKSEMVGNMRMLPKVITTAN
ncbi:cold-inducible protein YdjO-related protein [Paenibacillus phyllosphaerae]|uniref:cold-inducible protein YdjO-related protein n=1 Tax=Paenibacillus phyllosphaerae TaxID=274593 RepID=UPI001620A98E|nr:cold-inducible protein YdjO-related protein [Paenibacillus phyllosphaerae]